MKTFGFIITMIALSRILLWLFPNSNSLLNYGLLPLGIFGAILIVISEMRQQNVPAE